MRNAIRRTATLTFIIAGCSAPDDAARSATGGGDNRTDACALITPTEMSAIVGGEIADTSGRFTEHRHTKPVTYSAGCHYMGPGGAVMFVLHYPVTGAAPSAEQLAARMTDHVRSIEESDPAIAEAYRTVQVRPVTDLSAPAAAYELAGMTTLEARVGNRTLQVNAGSRDAAVRVARRVIERLG